MWVPEEPWRAGKAALVKIVLSGVEHELGRLRSDSVTSTIGNDLEM